MSSFLNFFKSQEADDKPMILNFMEDDPETNDQTSMINKVKNNITSSIEVETNYTTFFIVFAIGLLFLTFSFLFLPMVILFPQKFVSLFCIGSIILLSSFIFIYGTRKYLGMLFKGKRSVYTVIYLSSIAVGFYYSFYNSNYLFCLISAVVQVTMLIIFVLSFIPGGESGISFILNGFKFMVNGLWSKLISK
jgi:hypothetical protein